MGRKKRVLNFRSKESYRKWLAYGHIHKVFEKTPGHTKVRIRGKPHKVKHSSSGKSSRRKNKKKGR